MALPATRSDVELQHYSARLAAAGLDAPWSRPGPLIEPKKTRVKPQVWRWVDIEPLLRESAEFVAPHRGAERRILRLANTGVPERTSTHTISIAVQYLLPGEVAPAHRHTPNAIRFMLQGRGAYTTVEGEKCVMQRGDLVLTPSLTWHDHGDEGPEAVIWLDGLDSPIVRYLENLFMEPYPDERQPARRVTGASQHHFHYRWESTYAALLERAKRETSPVDDAILEYTDPTTGQSVLPTLGCYLQLIRPGVRTRAHRETSSAVYYVIQGTGFSVIDGARYEWGPGDFFAVPPRAPHAHGNDASTPAVLFSLQDVPLLRALGQYREEVE